ncbi:MAG: universal stress protein [Chitinophagaceae bacterium]|nr:universal stress protein [Chitinophagaceae bacterium]
MSTPIAKLSAIIEIQPVTPTPIGLNQMATKTPIKPTQTPDQLELERLDGQIAELNSQINEFADANSTDIVIVIPQKHGLFESIFTKSHTKQLAFHSHIPIMVVHD